MDRRTRATILSAAKRLLGTPYDFGHDDPSWRDLRATPKSFDCSTFLCRIAMDALGVSVGRLIDSAGWLLDHLVEVRRPAPGDVVGYGRAGTTAEAAAGYDVLWHVMLYVGNGQVLGACDVAGQVVARPLDSEVSLGRRQWRLIAAPPFRLLQLK